MWMWIASSQVPLIFTFNLRWWLNLSQQYLVILCGSISFHFFFGPYQSGKQNNCIMWVTVQISILWEFHITHTDLTGNLVMTALISKYQGVCVCWQECSLEMAHLWMSLLACVSQCMLACSYAFYCVISPQAFHTHKHTCRCAYVTLCLGVRMSPFPKD